MNPAPANIGRLATSFWKAAPRGYGATSGVL